MRSPHAAGAQPSALRTGPLRLGLTGGIGSGKSTVASILVAAGAVRVDADAISRQLTATGGAAIGALRQALGPQVIGPDLALDRAAMRQRLIDDPSAKARLEQVLHPLIRDEIERQARGYAAAPCIVFDIPLLVENLAEWRPRLDRILVVDCSVERQVQRVVTRSGWTPATVRAIIARQATREQRRAVADAVIANDEDDLTQLRTAVLAAVLPWAPGLTAQ